MAYEPSTAIGLCASSAHGQNWESVTADWKMPIIERRIENTVQLSRPAPIFPRHVWRGYAPTDFGRIGVVSERQRARRGIAKSVG